jgi:uncharacterized ferredoxin-like protein
LPIIKSNEAEMDGLLQTAKLMAVSARTAPKSGGKDDIHVMIIYGKEKDDLAEEMEKIGMERKIQGFIRDAKNVRDSSAVLLIGVEGMKKFGLNCGACGYKSCEGFEKAEKTRGLDFIGPTCIFKALDLGIALGSAAKMASMNNADNRIMYRIGVAAIRLNLMKEASVIMGIPISAKGKNIYFDRTA